MHGIHCLLKVWALQCLMFSVLPFKTLGYKSDLEKLSLVNKNKIKQFINAQILSCRALKTHINNPAVQTNLQFNSNLIINTS